MNIWHEFVLQNSLHKDNRTLTGVVGDDVDVMEGSALGGDDREGTCVGIYDGD